MLAHAQHKAQKSGTENCRLRVGDAYTLDFADDTFDVVINNYMFDLLPEQDFLAVLEEFKRVLCPGGRLVMVNMTKGTRWYHSIWEDICRINPAWMGGCRGVYLLPHLEAVSFEGIRREFISQMTFPFEVILSRNPLG